MAHKMYTMHSIFILTVAITEFIYVITVTLNEKKTNMRLF